MNEKVFLINLGGWGTGGDSDVCVCVCVCVCVGGGGGVGGWVVCLTERVSLCFVNKLVQKFLLKYLNNKRKFQQTREINKLAKTF